MIEDAQKVLESLFSNKHINGSPFFNPETFEWHVIFKNGKSLITKNLIDVQMWIDSFDGKKVEWK